MHLLNEWMDFKILNWIASPWCWKTEDQAINSAKTLRVHVSSNTGLHGTEIDTEHAVHMMS